MRRLRPWLAFLAGGCIVFGSIVFGCSSFGSSDATSDGDAGTDGPAASPADLDGTVADGRTSDSGCPSRGGPEMVEILGFCIDRTEVTVGQYAAFLRAMSEQADRGLSNQPPECSGNTSFDPPYWWPSTPTEVDAGLSKAEIDRMPITVVDWCDARAFCAWAGKRLCGRMGGGQLAANEAVTTASEWFVACTHNGLYRFPYGDDYVQGACNVASSARRAVGASAACSGGYEGLHDMSGNVEEWVDACSAVDGGTQCALSGGTYNFDATSVDCRFFERKLRSESLPQAGFRCCATP